MATLTTDDDGKVTYTMNAPDDDDDKNDQHHEGDVTDADDEIQLDPKRPWRTRQS